MWQEWFHERYLSHARCVLALVDGQGSGTYLGATCNRHPRLPVKSASIRTGDYIHTRSETHLPRFVSQESILIYACCWQPSISVSVSSPQPCSKSRDGCLFGLCKLCKRHQKRSLVCALVGDITNFQHKRIIAQVRTFILSFYGMSLDRIWLEFLFVV